LANGTAHINQTVRKKNHFRFIRIFVRLSFSFFVVFSHHPRDCWLWLPHHDFLVNKKCDLPFVRHLEMGQFTRLTVIDTPGTAEYRKLFASFMGGAGQGPWGGDDGGNGGGSGSSGGGSTAQVTGGYVCDCSCGGKQAHRKFFDERKAAKKPANQRNPCKISKI
jgi:uncharacterized membrane protein YgcG